MYSPRPLHHRPDLQSDLLGASRRHLEEPRLPVDIDVLIAAGDVRPFDRVQRHHATRFRPVRTVRPATAARTTRISSALARTPAAPSASICIAAPVARASSRQPGSDPRVSRSSADQVAAGTPVRWAAIVERHRLDELAAPAADAITACSGGTCQDQPSIASTVARVRIQAGAAITAGSVS